MAVYSTSDAQRYDAIPYQSAAVTGAHPAHLATMGTLFGMQPVDLNSCRVLELGCAEGGHLLPLAELFPNSQFVGVDYSPKQIEIGQQVVDRIGLQNLDLRAADILNLEDDLGEFDYIIAHGVFSWVPLNVRLKILDLYTKHLSPNGIGYVSYTTYPGGHMRMMAREMMLYHGRNSAEPLEKSQSARQFLDYMVDTVSDEYSAYKGALAWEQKNATVHTDQQLCHDLLSEVHEPIYFHQFVELLEQRELKYLGDSRFATMLPRRFGDSVLEELKKCCRTMIDVEQYIDFLCNRTFRQTLICRQPVALNHAVDPAHVASFYVSSRLRPVEKPVSLASDKEELFRDENGGELKSKVPLTKAAISVLSEHWPENIRVDELVDLARSRLQQEAGDAIQMGSVEADKAMLADSVLQSYAGGIVELSVLPTLCTSKVNEYPQATTAARLTVEMGARSVTNQRHETVNLDQFQRLVLQHMDGSKSCHQLLTMLTDFVLDGQLAIEGIEQTQAADRAKIEQLLTDQLANDLQAFAQSALLNKP